MIPNPGDITVTSDLTKGSSFLQVLAVERHPKVPTLLQCQLQMVTLRTLTFTLAYVAIPSRETLQQFAKQMDNGLQLRQFVNVSIQHRLICYRMHAYTLD